MRSVLILILSVFMFTGCAGTGYQVRRATEVQHALVQKKEQVNQQTRAYIDGAEKALLAIPVDFKSSQSTLALRLVEDAQESVGLPDAGFKIDVPALLSQNKQEQDKAQLDLSNKEALLTKALTDQKALEDELQQTKDKLADIAVTKYDAEKKSWISRIESWGTIILLGGGLVALCIFFPGIIPWVVKGAVGIVTGIFAGFKALIPKSNGTKT